MSINSNLLLPFFFKRFGRIYSFLQNSPNKHYKETKNDASLDRSFSSQQYLNEH